jgi:CAAX prenyl protease-like protein
MVKRIINSALLIRVIPFAVFALLTYGQGLFGEHSIYWVYTLKTAVGALLLWFVYRHVGELRWNFSWQALLVGVAVFLVWIGFDGYYPLYAKRLGTYNPFNAYGQGSTTAWFFLIIRLVGSTLIVPPLEEVFYRSFLYRFLIRTDFLSVPLGRFHLKAFLFAALVFGLSHYEWIAGILCALAFQWLVCRKNRLGDAITAHAITNFLLALWVIFRNDYKFW